MAELLAGGGWLTEDGTKHVEVRTEELDFAFIEKCGDAGKVRAIVDVLQSGKEGHYPELQKCAEARLLTLLPEKERLKLNRLKHATTPLEVAEAAAELERRRKEVAAKDTLLKTHSQDESTENRTAASMNIFGTKGSGGALPSSKKLPPVRGSAAAAANGNGSAIPASRSVHVTSSATSVSSSSSKDVEREDDSKPKPTRISGYDFKAWEKFDVDAACEEVAGGEQPLASLSSAISSGSGRVDVKASNAEKRSAAHKREMEQLQNEMGANNLTPIQKTTRAAREKVKGNECHRIGEDEEAFACYSRSLALDPKNNIVYANRAITCIRLDRFDLAEDDCTRSLSIDNNYVKAWARRGMARFKMGKYKDSAADFEEAAMREPTNAEFKSLAENAAAKFAEVEGRQLPLKFKTSDAVAPSKPNTARDADPAQGASTSIPVLEVESVERLGLPLKTAVQVACGKYLVSSTPVFAAPSSGFTRIAISLEDDDEDDDDDEEEDADNNEVNEVAVEKGQESTNGTAAIGGGGTLSEPTKFTRIAVCEEEDDEEENDAKEDSSTQVPSTEWDVDLVKQQAMKELSQGNFSMAISMLEKTLSSSFFASSVTSVADAKVSLLSLLASALSASENYSKTIQVCDEITAIQPKNFKALSRRASANLKLGRKTEAENDCRAILAIDPCNSEANSLLNELGIQEPSQTLEASSANDKKIASVQLKDKGNEAMARQAYSEALGLYSRAISFDADNLLCYNNRAQALLKLSRFIEAEKDAALVMDKLASDKLSPHFLKAAFRRALALRGMGGAGNLNAAVTLLEDLSRRDPGNKDFKSELSRTLVLQKDATLRPATPVAVVSSSSPLSPALDMIERTSIKRTPPTPPTAAPPATAQLPPTPPAVSNSQPAKSARVPKSESPAASSVRLTKEPEVPSTPPSTVYELERNWRALKSNPKLFSKYLTCFKPSTFKKVFKEAVSSELLSSMMVALKDHSTPDECVATLAGLSQSACFDMTLTMLPAEDIENLRGILGKLDVSLAEGGGKLNATVVSDLRVRYKL